MRRKRASANRAGSIMPAVETSASQPSVAKRSGILWPCFCSPSRLLYPFAFGLVLVPLVIVLHECGHFGVMSLQGLHPHFTPIGVYTTSASREWRTGTGEILSSAAGPLVELLCCIGGFAWLRVRRKDRWETNPDAMDWLATVLTSMLNPPVGQGFSVISKVTDALPDC